MDPQLPTATARDLRVLITAAEAYPEMERAFLQARREIWAGFRVFDLSTRLRSPEACAIGDTWFDLIVDTLQRGVKLHIALSDFDPIMAPDLHCSAWKAKRAFIAAAEVVGPDAELEVVAATHSARVGLLPRIVLWPGAFKRLRKQARRLNAATPEDRAQILECSPGLRLWLLDDGSGGLRARRWPAPPLVPGTHHQKIAVFDRELLCVGGLDLDERRYDDKGHHRRRDKTWYDVQVMCRGPVVADAQRHLEQFLKVVAGEVPPEPSGALLTTLSRRRRFSLPFLSPQPVDNTIAAAHRRLIAGARRLIYLETQYFRDPAVSRELADAARRNPDLGLILILPAAPEDVAFNGVTSSDVRFGEYLQAKAIARVQDAFGERAVICSPVRPKAVPDTGRDVLCGSPIIYVHAKVSIFDADHAIVSSANLNSRSLCWDTEAGVLLDRPEDVEMLKRRLIDHWMGGDAPSAFHDMHSARAAWQQRAAENARKSPEDRQGFIVPHATEPAVRLGRFLPVPPALV